MGFVLLAVKLEPGASVDRVMPDVCRRRRHERELLPPAAFGWNIDAAVARFDPPRVDHRHLQLHIQRRVAVVLDDHCHLHRLVGALDELRPFDAHRQRPGLIDRRIVRRRRLKQSEHSQQDGQFRSATLCSARSKTFFLRKHPTTNCANDRNDYRNPLALGCCRRHRLVSIVVQLIFAEASNRLI